MRVLAVLMVLMVLVSVCVSSLFHHHHNRRRHYQRHRVRPAATRRVTHVRSERKAEECQPHEHHLICGPERHCDRSCENMFSPPHCTNSLHHAKCYFPRCVCNQGYVRDAEGVCIKASQCPNTYYEPASIIRDGDDNEMMIAFEPVKFSRIGHHKVLRTSRKHRKPFVPGQISNKKI